MQDIRELILLLKQHKAIPFSAQDEGGRLAMLYEGIAKGQYKTDEEASAHLYPAQGGSSAYRKLKSDLRDKLQESVLHIDQHAQDLSDYQRAYHECHKQWVMVRILTAHNANTAAIMMANRLLRQATKYEFSLLCMDVCSFLRVQYGLRESDDKKYKDANKLFAHHKDVYQAESLAEEYYTDLVVGIVNSRSAKDQLAEKSQTYFEQIAPYLQQYTTYKLHLYGHLIGLMRFTGINDYEAALSHCEQAITFFEHKPYEARAPLQIFYYQRLVCNIYLRQFEKGRESAEYCMKVMKEGSFNWFKYRELYHQLSLYTGRYQEAWDILQGTLKNSHYEFLPDNVKELWRIRESFSYFLGILGKFKLPKSYHFKLAKFLNETPIFSKDKSGLNISILVVRLLLLLIERKYDKVLDEVEATEQYAYRHLRGLETKRSYYFIKMLLQVPLSGFDLQDLPAKTLRYSQKLAQTPLQVANQVHETEIIPYEDLWAMILEALAIKKTG